MVYSFSNVKNRRRKIEKQVTLATLHYRKIIIVILLNIEQEKSSRLNYTDTKKTEKK